MAAACVAIGYIERKQIPDDVFRKVFEAVAAS
jgi:hypothetical protein